MPKNHDILTIEATLKHEIPQAYLVDVGRGGVWVPKSMCEYSDGELQIPQWLAEEKELV